MTFIRKYITNPISRPFMRFSGAKITPQWVCIHWTANEAETAGAEAHYRYFQNGAPSAKGPLNTSVHYVVDSNTIIQLIPDTEPAHHVGDKPRRESAIRSEVLRNARPEEFITKSAVKNPNYCGVIGIEMCVNGGIKHPRFKNTESNTVLLAAYLLMLYDLKTDRLIRHFDISGKDCPKFYLEDTVFAGFKRRVASMQTFLTDMSYIKGVVTAHELNVRSGPGVQNPVIFKLQKGDAILFRDNGAVWQEYLPGAFLNTKFIQEV